MHGFFGYRGCARRAYGGHFGGFGAHFGHGGGLGGRGFFGGRKLGSGELQLSDPGAAGRAPAARVRDHQGA